MKVTIKNQFDRHIVCQPQRDEILNMIDKGKDSQVIEDSLVEITKSFRKDGLHEVEVFVHG